MKPTMSMDGNPRVTLRCPVRLGPDDMANLFTLYYDGFEGPLDPDDPDSAKDAREKARKISEADLLKNLRHWITLYGTEHAPFGVGDNRLWFVAEVVEQVFEERFFK